MAAPADISPETLLDLLNKLTANTQRRRRRRTWFRRVSQAAAIFAIFSAGTFAALHYLKRHPSRTAGAKVHPQPTSKPRTTATTHATSAVVASNTRPRAARLMVLTVRATRGSSWLMARVGDANGRLLFQGVLKTGQATTLRGESVWVRFGASSNLDLRLDGKPIRLTHSGTVDALFTRGGASAPTTS